jgi:hypothetical protein
MKKIKFSIMTLAILLSIGGAFATRPHFDCRTATQYYFNGASYLPAGAFGVDYICQGQVGTCTYTCASNVYTPCQFGEYVPVPQIKAK